MQPRHFSRGRRVTEKEINKIDFLKLSAIVPAVLIIWGITKQIFYYQEFNVSILLFLDFSEIVTSFLGNLMRMFIIFLLVVLIITEDKFRVGHLSDYRKPRLLFLILHFFISNMHLLYPVLFLIYLATEGRFTGENLANFTMYLAFSIAAYSVYKKSQLKNYFSTYSWNILFALAFGLILTAYFTALEIDNVKNNKIYAGIVIQLDSTSVNSDSSNIIKSDGSQYYIGKTTGYVFIFNEKNNSTTVFPVDRIKQIIFPNKSGKEFSFSISR